MKPIAHSPQDTANFGTYAMFMHFALFLPCINWLIILILWLAKKQESPLVKQHGTVLINFMLSTLIYIVIYLLVIYLTLSIHIAADMVILDFYQFIGLVAGLVFLVVIFTNAMNASRGKAGSYFMAFKFFSSPLSYESLSLADHLID